MPEQQLELSFNPAVPMDNFCYNFVDRLMTGLSWLVRHDKWQNEGSEYANDHTLSIYNLLNKQLRLNTATSILKLKEIESLLQTAKSVTDLLKKQ